jgi:hypothetical protein
MAARRDETNGVTVTRRGKVKPAPLPITEFTFDRAGAGSPFGDDLRFPLTQVSYEHPEPSDLPQ